MEHTRIAIIGAGFAGIGMAVRLEEAGERDFVVLERDGDIGGTWAANTYPGCQCDVPAKLYSFSFAPNPDWTRSYPLQGELRAYLRQVAERFGVRNRIRLNTAVTAGTWDEETHCWRLETSAGPLTADVIVAAPGPLSEPTIPALPGLEDFRGATFHTARWNHDYDLRGRRVAVIGTGASAIQAVPNVREEAEHVTVFQRTPPWVVPHNDRAITPLERKLFARFPLLQRAGRAGVYWQRELLVPGLTRDVRLMKLVQHWARAHLFRQVRDPRLRARLTPDYTIGCKRILPSNRWYPALTKPNVGVVTEGIAEVGPGGITDGAGRHHPLDAIIFATGFQVTDIPIAERVRGMGDRLLSDFWDGSPTAYKGATVPGFPNSFLLAGPNIGLGHNSIVFMIEAQIRYVLDALQQMRRTHATRIEVRPEAHAAYNEALQRRMPPTVWNSGGCASWYIDRNGRNTTMWPDFTWRFWWQTRRFDAGAYRLSRRDVREHAPASHAAAAV
jgi:cation diffusion facilitator CzcD-associated flavoprotein CzcO